MAIRDGDDMASVHTRLFLLTYYKGKKSLGELPSQLQVEAVCLSPDVVGPVHPVPMVATVQRITSPINVFRSVGNFAHA